MDFAQILQRPKTIVSGHIYKFIDLSNLIHDVCTPKCENRPEGDFFLGHASYAIHISTQLVQLPGQGVYSIFENASPFRTYSLP